MPFRPIGRTPDFGSGDYGSNPWRAIMTDFTEGKWKVKINGFEGPYKERWTKRGDYVREYDNGAVSFITREFIEAMIEDDRTSRRQSSD